MSNIVHLAKVWQDGGWSERDAIERLKELFRPGAPRFDARDKMALACLLLFHDDKKVEKEDEH